MNDKKRSKCLVQESGAQKKSFGYQVIHQNSLTSCQGNNLYKLL